MLARLAIIAAVSWPLGAAFGVQTEEGELPPPHTQREVDTAQPAPPEGLWPSKKLLNLMLGRWAEQVSEKYGMDDVQTAKLRAKATERWSGFLEQNRSEIQPIVNEFIEMRMELQPPQKDRVQAWAERTTPVFDKFRAQLDQGMAEFREILTYFQRVKFEIDALKLGVGMKLAEGKLKQWKNGEFDENEFWEPTAAERRRRRAERRRRREEAEKTAEADATAPAVPTSADASTTPPPDQTDQIAVELEAWGRYVEEFIRIYVLDEGQRDAVLSVLSELKDRAIAHRDRRRADIAKLEQRIKTFNGADDQLLDLKKRLTELYGPIDDMFKELKRRAEQIPTQKQRARVAQHSE